MTIKDAILAYMSAFSSGVTDYSPSVNIAGLSR